MKIFCLNCNTYFPTGEACPECGWQRPLLHTPAPPGQPLWQARLPGRAATQLAFATIDGTPALLAGWAFLPRRTDSRPQDGGVVAFDLARGQPLWERRLGMPVQGGPTLAGASALVGYGESGVGAGRGRFAALDLATGEIAWQEDTGGNVRGQVILAESLLFFVADDGALHTWRLPPREEVWRRPAAPKPGPMPAAPAPFWFRNQLRGVITGSYTSGFDRKPAWLTAYDLQGRQLWREALEGSVRDQPLVAGRKVFVASFRQYRASAGILMAYGVHTGKPLWPEPFRAEDDRSKSRFIARPLLHKGVLYQASLDHHLYAIDAATGKLRWRWQGEHGIATRVVLVEGLLIFGDTAGVVHAVDPASQEEVWRYDLGSPIVAHPLVAKGVIFVAGEDGQVAALPWHGGRYAWATERLIAAGRWDEAGDLWALAAVYHHQHEDTYRAKAMEAWARAGQWQKMAYALLAEGMKSEALETLMSAGRKLRLRARGRAAILFWQAHRLAFRLHRFEMAQKAGEAMSELAHLPFLQIESRNVGDYEQWQEGRLTLRIENVGKAVAPDGIHFWLGGGLQAEASYHVPGEIHPGQMHDIPLTIIPTARESTLVVEYRYATGRQDFPSLRGMLEIPIHARPPRQKPMQIGDVQQLHVTIAASTEEGVAIETGDVALFKSQGDIRNVHIEGAAGAVINRCGDMGDVTTGGDVGFLRSSKSRDSQ